MRSQKMSWCLRRIRKLLPVVLTFLSIYLLYWLTTHSGDSDEAQELDMTPLARTVPPPPAPTTALPQSRSWLIVSSSEVYLCNKLAAEFADWIILFVSSETIPLHSHSACQSIGNIRGAWEVTLHGAYLYAISQGAEVIYVTDHATDLKTLQRPPHPPLKTQTSGLVCVSNHSASVFDANSYYGCDVVRTKPKILRWHRLCQTTSAIYAPAVIHTKVLCDETAPHVTLAPGLYCDLQLSGTLFMRSSFWALLLLGEISVEYRLVWGSVVQWLIWQMGSGVTVFLDSTRQSAAHTNRSQDHSNVVLQLLSNVTCGSELTSCVHLIAQRMVHLGLGSESFLHSIGNWFTSLADVGYIFPTLTGTIKDDCGKPVLFHPVDFSSPKITGKRLLPVANINASRLLYNKMCPGNHSVTDPFNRAEIDLSRPWTQFRHVVLVFTFNKAHYEVIPYLELLYRSIFPRILYCGPRYLNRTEAEALEPYKFSLVTYDEGSADRGNLSGSLSYQCVSKVARMGYRASGFLFASDDLLLLPEPLTRLKQDRVWFLPENEVRIGDVLVNRECRLGMCDFFPRWNWWEDFRLATIRTLEVMRALGRTSPLFHRCLSELQRLNGNNTVRANGGFSDIFYLPASQITDFSALSEVFLERGVFVEIAVPTILRCLELPEDVQPLPGKTVWDETRDQPWKYFTRSNLFRKTYLHPVKWSPLGNKSAEHIQLYCSSVLPYIYDPFSRLQ